MNKIDIYLNKNLDEKLISELEKKIYYISENIVKFRRIYSGSTCSAIRLYMTGIYDENEIKERFYDIIANEIVGLKNIKINRIWDDDVSNFTYCDRVLKECIEKKYIYIPSEGRITLKEPLASLLLFFDDIFKIIAIKMHSCENYYFPTLLGMNTLKKVGYFESFPHLLMFAARLKNDVANYKGFIKTFKEINNKNFPNALLNYCCCTDLSLSPTICYHVYETLENHVIDNYSVTACGKVFRYEDKYQKPFERLWDFTLREVVFLGERDFVQHQVQSYCIYTIKFMKLLQLHGFCETASDPFFLVDDASKKINIQKMMHSKYELQLRTSVCNTLAVASFNFHNQHLSKKFNLYAPSSNQKKHYCHTGCIGIGLERLIFAFLSQYGCDYIKWPKIIRDYLNAEISANNILEILCEIKL